MASCRSRMLTLRMPCPGTSTSSKFSFIFQKFPIFFRENRRNFFGRHRFRKFFCFGPGNFSSFVVDDVVGRRRENPKKLIFGFDQTSRRKKISDSERSLRFKTASVVRSSGFSIASHVAKWFSNYYSYLIKIHYGPFINTLKWSVNITHYSEF